MEQKDKKCRHKITGKEGIIKSELKGNKKFSDQWGIFGLLPMIRIHQTIIIGTTKIKLKFCNKSILPFVIIL